MLLDFRGHRDNLRLTRIYDVSKKWGDQVLSLSEKFLDNLEEQPISVSSYATAMMFFIAKFASLVEIISGDYKQKFLNEGVKSFFDRGLWLHVDCQIVNNLERASEVRRCLLYLYRVHNNDWGIMPPHMVDVGFVPFPSSSSYVEVKLHTISERFMKDYLAALASIDRTPLSERELFYVKNATHMPLVKAQKNGVCLQAIKEKGLDGFEDNYDLMDYLISVTKNSKKTKGGASAYHRILEAHRPGLSPFKVVIVRGFSVDYTDLYRFSAKLYEGIQEYITSHYNNLPLGNRKEESLKDKMVAFKKVLILSSVKLGVEELKFIKEQGFYAFVKDVDLLRRVFEIAEEQNKRSKNSIFGIIDICKVLYPEEKLSEQTVFPLVYYFPTDFNGDDEVSKIDLGLFYTISERLYDDFRNYIDEALSNIDSKSININTVRHFVEQFKAIFSKYSKRFSPEHIDNLHKYGIKGLAKGDFTLQKYINLQLQTDVTNGHLKRKTGSTYRRALKHLMKDWGLQWIDAYPINSKKHDEHLKRLNVNDYYSVEECREIAFYIEKLLNAETTTNGSKVLLYFARIILKTGWNYTPLLKLELDDIRETSSPLNPRGKTSIILQKSRAGYRTDSYSFSANNTLSKSTVRSAAKDILYVKNVLTKEFRDALPEGSPIKSFVFIRDVKENGISQLNKHASKSIISLLEKAGCNVTFSPRKIRKGGMNYIYRKVVKDIVAYEHASKHSFQVFEASYFRHDLNHSRNTLNKATSVMSDYFKGKEITEGIYIVTEVSDDWQHTPTGGGCSSKGEANELSRYNKEHKKLHLIDGKEHNYCADFLGCIWCKFFRVVADPEHVWKLLSYKVYILSEMEGSVVDYENNEEQIDYIRVLKKRVNRIIEKVRSGYPGIVEQAEQLLSDNGMHPDWEFAISITSVD